MRPPRSFASILLAYGCPLALALPVFGEVDTVVVFNEIHYHPSAGAEGSEFVELYNQNSVNVDLSGWTLEGAGTFLFEKGTTIEGRSFLVVAKDPGVLGAADALGPFPGALANDGEVLTLRNHNGRVMDRIDYRDSHPWPTGADGSGASLAKRDPFTASGRPGNWRSSRALGGTPESGNDTEAVVKPVVFSEIPGFGETPFWVELTNPGEQAVDLTGLQVVTGTGEVAAALTGDLGPGTYLQVPLSLNTAAEDGLRVFVLDPGEGVFLDAGIVQERPRARIDFPAGRFLVTPAATPGEANTVPIDDRIVINEIMYHHRPDYEDPDEPDSVYRENDEEWIELTNRGDEVVDLSGWRLRAAIEYEFEEGVTLAPDAFLVVARNAAVLAEKIPDIAIVGDFRGSLNNGDERVELQDPAGNPVDAVHYFGDRPWPADADGGGSSLELRNPGMDNEVPEAWVASDESLKSEWHTYTYRAVAQRPVYTAGVRSFHELRVGFIQAGSCLMDNVSVVEDPDGARTEIARNRTFGSLFAPVTASNWRLIGNHEQSEAIMDPEAGAVLKVVAESSMNYLNNLCEGSLTKEVETGKEYEVSFDAKWLSGSSQLRTEVYYNKFAKKHILEMPEKHGTPGARNTAFEETPGPTFRALRHAPAVPGASDEVSVFVAAEDPDGIESLTLRYSVDEGNWQDVPMAVGDDGAFHGVVPAQARNAIIQFYVEGRDLQGGVSWHPAGGPDSGAFVQVDNAVGTDQRQTMRLILKDSDSDLLHDPLLILSNARRPATLIMNESDITYGCAVRQRGSMFSRSGAGAGLNIKFPGDRLFRGVQPTVIIRWRNPHEILVKHMANQAGDVPTSYNDFLEYRGYRSDHSGLIRMEMARFGENFLAGAYENGDEEPVFKMEGIRDFQQEGPGGIKRPMPIGWIVQYDLADLGDDKEQYRHVLRMINARRRDDYSAMLDLCKAFSAPDESFREAIEAVIDTDQWCRMMAVQTLCGIADVYPVENPHNMNFYRRPTDRKIISIPWDWDFVFNLAASSRIIDPRSSNKNLWRLLEEPGINRLFRGHLLDVIDTVFNETYADEWFRHYAEVGGVNYNSQIGYVRSRASNVRGQAASQTPFQILTNDGDDLTVDGSEVTLQGAAGVRVRTIEHLESGLTVEPRWIDDETWEFTVPLGGEVNTVTLQARDYQGTKGSLFNPAGSDRITITNTSAVDAPQAGGLLISEFMYHSATPTPAEVAAGHDDQNSFEFIEIVNGGSRSVNLASLAFTDGLTFDFAEGADPVILEAGAVGLLVADRAAFELRYGPGLPVLGVYTGNLANEGERVTLAAGNARVIVSFSYDDRAPWPESADGEGYSLTLTDLSGGADANASESWRASALPGGTPGVIESAPETLRYVDWVAEEFSEEEREKPEISGFEADLDGDGLANALEFVLGSSPRVRDSSALQATLAGEVLRLTFFRRIDSEWTVVAERSADLRVWEPLGQERIQSETAKRLEQREDVNLSVSRSGAKEYFRLRVESGEPAP